MFGIPLDTISNAKKPLYIAHQIGVRYDDDNNELPIYGKPFYYGMVNYMPLVGNALESYIKAFGETNYNIARCFIDYKDKNLFHQFDIAYLYDKSPNGELVNGDNANYIIKAVKPQNTKVMILFEEIIKGDKNYEENESQECKN